MWQVQQNKHLHKTSQQKEVVGAVNFLEDGSADFTLIKHSEATPLDNIALSATCLKSVHFNFGIS